MSNQITKDAHIGDYKLDPRNARKHNPRNVGMIERSLSRVGSGRSLVASREGTILAGNATLEAAASAGIEEAIVIPTYGDKLIIHQRLDLSDADARATELALYDNRSAELAEWDTDILNDLREGSLDLDQMWSERELAVLFDEQRPEDRDLDASPQLGDLQYRVVVDLSDEDAQADFIAEMGARNLACRALIS